MCGVLAPLIFAALVAIASTLYEGYSHMAQAISELGGVESRYPLVQSTNFFILGILIVAFALGLHHGVGDGRGSKLGPILIGLFGISSGVANALLPCDAGCQFQSLTGTMHNLTGLGGFLAAIAGLFFISRRLKGDPRWQSYQRYTVITGIVALVSLLIWIVSKAAELESVDGLLQRVFVVAWLQWIEVMALRLFWLSREPLGKHQDTSSRPNQDTAPMRPGQPAA